MLHKSSWKPPDRFKPHNGAFKWPTQPWLVLGWMWVKRSENISQWPVLGVHLWPFQARFRQTWGLHWNLSSLPYRLESSLYSNHWSTLPSCSVAEGQNPNAFHTFDCFCQTSPTSWNHNYNQKQGNSLHNQPPRLGLIFNTSCVLTILDISVSPGICFGLFSRTIKTLWLPSI